jgi:hypothetical protein
VKVYRGIRVIDLTAGRHRGVVVTVVDRGQERPLDPRFDIRNHSPTGFEWGYPGSGPTQLALAILCDLIGSRRAIHFYQVFKWGVINNLKDEQWMLTDKEINDWLESQVVDFFEQSSKEAHR